jgi:hypothetical protein
MRTEKTCSARNHRAQMYVLLPQLNLQIDQERLCLKNPGGDSQLVDSDFIMQGLCTALFR